MQLSLFSDYSLRLLMFAAVKGSSFQIEEVTSAYDISRHHLAKIVQNLSRLGYLETRRGRGGGILLARLPEEIFIGRLLRETEGQSAIVECFDPATNTCRIHANCRLKGALAKAMSAFYASLDELSLQDLVAGPQRSRLSKILLTTPTTDRVAR